MGPVAPAFSPVAPAFSPVAPAFGISWPWLLPLGMCMMRSTLTKASDVPPGDDDGMIDDDDDDDDDDNDYDYDNSGVIGDI